MPERIQRRRTAGWRMPATAVYVGRPTRWGNPYAVGETTGHGQVRDRAHAVTLYEAYTALQLPWWYADVRTELGGRDLCCWCPPDQPCHSDVLLRLANTPEVTR